MANKEKVRSQNPDLARQIGMAYNDLIKAKTKRPQDFKFQEETMSKLGNILVSKPQAIDILIELESLENKVKVNDSQWQPVKQ